MQTGNQLSRVLRSLSPETADDVSLLRTVLTCAETIQRRAHGDLAIRGGGVGGPGVALKIKVMTGVSPVDEAERFIRTLPADMKKYFDGLVEAFEIYHSIHGTTPVLTGKSDRTLQELRQIRDLCLEEGLRSVF